MGTVYEDQYTFVIISHSFPLSMKNISDKSYGEIQNTHFVFSNFFLKSCPHEIMWKNIVEPDTPLDNMAYAHCTLDT